MGTKWLVGLPVIAILGLTLMVGRGVTGRATGGEADVTGGGCGGEAGEPVAQEESALVCADCPPPEPTEDPNAPQCNYNGVKDHYETDVDCGGRTQSGCGSCAAGKRCSVNNDCQSGTCSGGICLKSLGSTCGANAECGSGICGRQYFSSTNSYTYTCVRPCDSDAGCSSGWKCSELYDVTYSLTRPVCHNGTKSAPSSGGSGYVVAPLTFGTPSNYSYTSGSTTWYQDYFTKKWCTGSTLTTGSHGWDYVQCDWSGWQYQNNNWYYCDRGSVWDDGHTHYHCP